MEDSDVLEGFRMTEIGLLPEEWKVVKLGDLAEVKYGKAKPETEGSIPVVGSGGIYSYTSYALVDFSTLVIGRKGTAGVVWLLEQPFWPSDTTFYLSWKKSNIDYRYVFDFLQANPLSGEHAKTTLPSLKRSDLENQFIPLPPLPEQKQIAFVLSTIQQAIEKTEAVINATKELKKSMMKHLFTYGPVSVEEAEHVVLRETDIGLMPEEWDVVRLGDVVREKITDGTHKTPMYVKAGIPFITATNLNCGKIDFSNCKFIPKEEHKLLIRRCKPEKGDILLSKVGTLGLTAKVNVENEFSIFVQVALLKPNSKLVNSDFLKYCLDSKPIQDQIIRKSSQSTMKYIGTGKIARLEIPLPFLLVQQRIASTLNTIDKKIETEQTRKKALEELFRTLLHNLMTGKIRVAHLEVPYD